MLKVFIFISSILLFPFGSFSQENMWMAGVAKQSITPPKGMWMAGYAHRDHPSEGKLHDLWVKVVVLEDQQSEKAVFVATDLLGLPRNISHRITERLMEELDLERKQIMLTSSHTHTGPVLRESLWDMYDLDDKQAKLIEKYSTTLEEKVVETVKQAVKQLQPVKVYTGSGVSRFAVNRRNNVESEILQVSELKGPVDHSVPVVRIEDSKGKVQAIIFGYACHATTLSSYEWSGDYAGFAQIHLEEHYPKAMALFFAGCAGDQNPLPRRSIALAEQYGRTLAASVIRVIEDEMDEQPPAFSATYKEIALPLSTAPDEAVLKAMLVDDQQTTYSRNWAERWLNTRAQGKTIPSDYPYYPIQTWKLGTQQMVALGGEVVVDYAIRLKKELDPSLFVVAYANDVMAYIPNVRILEEGGYEGHLSMHVYGMASTWDKKIETIIIEEVSRQLKALKD